MSDSPGKRLAFFRKHVGLSQRALGNVLSFSGGLIGQIEADLAVPSRAFLERISDAYGVSSDWLLNGHGEMLRPHGTGFGTEDLRIEPVTPGKPLGGHLTIGGVDFALVRRFDLAVSAGNGLVPASDHSMDRVAFPVEWLRGLDVVADLAALVSVQGDSMAPTIPDGAMVLIDARETTVTASGVYAFTLEGEAFVKRLVAAPQAKAITLISDNPAFPPRSISGPQLAQLRIAGRVRFVMHAV